jgi:hypothetical protein
LKQALPESQAKRLEEQQTGLLSPSRLMETCQAVCTLEDIPSPAYFLKVLSSSPQTLTDCQRRYKQVNRVEAVSTEELSQWAAWEASMNIVQLLDHQIAKLGAHRRYLTDALSRLPSVTAKEMGEAKPTYADLVGATTLTLIDPKSRKKQYMIEMDIKGVRSEIDPAAYLTCLLENERAIGAPQTKEIVQFLQYNTALKSTDLSLLKRIIAKQ